MATPEAQIGAILPQLGQLLPMLALSEDEDPEELAKRVAEDHRLGKRKRRHTDLTREKYLVHIDGEGDGQWADILGGSVIKVPPNITGGLRLQHNLLRPMTENMVSYHTAQDFEVVAQAKGSRESRDMAKIDTIWANDLIHRQNLNALVAEALFFAAAYGHCPIHAVWRDDNTSEAYEPLYDIQDSEYGMEAMPRRGYVDLFVGDPWDTVYNDGAKRHSVQWLSYGRVVPLDQVQEVFGEAAADLKGRKDLPSASRFQRIIRRWQNENEGTHGSAGITGEWGGDEMIALVCRETAPGILKTHPQGRLTIVALSGAAETDETWTTGYGGRAVLLHDGPLPGGRFSCVRFYANSRGDDVLGKPYVADLDDLQVKLNQLITHEVEFIRRYARPPLVTGPGGLVDDTVTTEDDAILEVVDASVKPMFLYPPAGGTNIFEAAIRRTEEAMFRIGGWQAASRGEQQAGQAAAAIVALARADDTIFGPVNRGIKDAVVELLQTAHALTRQYMTVPMVVSTIGDDMSYLAEPYIEASQMSPEPPDYAVVSGMGATPEARAQQLVSLSQTVPVPGAILSREDLIKRWPDRSMMPTQNTAEQTRKDRVAAISYAIQKIVKDVQAQLGPNAMMFVPAIHGKLMQAFPLLPDDPIPMHIEGLAQLTQDETEDPLVRQVAGMRQAMYMQVFQQQQAQMMAQQAQMGPAPGGRPEQKRLPSGRAGTPSSEQAEGSRNTVNRLTEAAKQGAV